ncbi:MAG TPA: CRTAC1 family protein, partial [Terriglobales bacterium]
KFTDVSFTSGTAVSGDGAEMAGMGIAVCDYNHSGRFSIHVTNFEDQYNSLFHNDGDMSFTDSANAAGIAAASSPMLGWGTGCTDFDNDGWPDLMAVNGHVYPQVDGLQAGAKYRETMLAFLNNGDGTFRDVSKSLGSPLTVPRPSRGAAFGDLDNDGDIDVVIENIDGAPLVLRNDGGNQNHWLTLELFGKTNREAIGARVKAVAGTMTQMDEVRSGGSFLSQNDMRVHFGLGDADKAERIEVRWPSGRIETLQNLSADHIYAVKEGEGIVPLERARPVARPHSSPDPPK